jgi:hypothetical protein
MNANQITIAGVTSAIITYKNRPVCTTQQLAKFYDSDPENIQKNFERNADRFTEGKHFIKLDGDALRAFRNLQPTDSRVQISPMVRSLHLWTELGAARHAKMLTTDKAWEVFEEMEGAYFRAKEAAKAAKAPGITRTQASIAKMLIESAAEHLKLAPSAVLGCYQRLESMAGVPGLLPAYSVDAPATAGAGSSEETKSVNELLEIHGVPMSAIAFNKRLVEEGFLREAERPSSKGGMKKFKVCTDMEYGKNLTNPNNPRETQPHWYVSKFAELLALVLPTANIIPIQEKML